MSTLTGNTIQLRGPVVASALAALLAAAPLFTACGGPGASGSESPTVVSTTGGPPPASDDPLDHALLEAVGGDGAVTLFLHPRHWSVLANALTSLAGDLMPDELRQILGATGPWEALRAATRLQGLALPPTLPGWDDSRPLVVSLFETPALDTRDLLSLSDTMRPEDLLTNRAVLPASDSETLLGSLASIAAAVGCEALPGSTEPALRCGDVNVLLDAGEGFVRIRLAEIGEPAGGIGPLARSPGAGLAATPAVRWAMTGSVVLAAHVRPSRLRRAFVALAATEAAVALRSAQPADQLSIRARARSELLGALLRTAPVEAEVDDLAVGLVPGLRPTFTLVQGLTPDGAAVYDAGLETPAVPEGPPEAPFLIRTTVNVDAMQAAAGVPFGFAGIGDLDAAEARIEQCGAPCLLNMLTGRVFGLGALADQTGLVAALEGEAGPLFRFAPTQLPPGVTMTMTLDVPTLVERMHEDMIVQRIAASIGVVHAVQVRQGRTLMTTARLGEEPPLPEPTAFASPDPGPGDEALSRSEGARCVEYAGLLVEATTEALRSTSLSNRAEVGEEAQQILASYGGCPDAPPALRPIYEGYARAFEAAVEAIPRRGH